MFSLSLKTAVLGQGALGFLASPRKLRPSTKAGKLRRKETPHRAYLQCGQEPSGLLVRPVLRCPRERKAGPIACVPIVSIDPKPFNRSAMHPSAWKENSQKFSVGTSGPYPVELQFLV